MIDKRLRAPCVTIIICPTPSLTLPKNFPIKKAHFYAHLESNHQLLLLTIFTLCTYKQFSRVYR